MQPGTRPGEKFMWWNERVGIWFTSIEEGKGISCIIIRSIYLLF